MIKYEFLLVKFFVSSLLFNGYSQVVLSPDDGLHYRDSSLIKLCEGSISYMDTIKYKDGYLLGDSLNIVFDNGIIQHKTGIDKDHHYEKYSIEYEDGKISDGVHAFVERTYYRNKTYDEIIDLESYCEGILNGLYIRHLKEKPNCMLLRGFYKNGKKQGQELLFLRDGSLKKESNWEKGRLHGLFREYSDDSGNVIFECTYKNGLVDGVLRTWWENGNLRSETQYISGKMNGESRVFMKNGELAFVQQIEMNKAIKTEIYVEEIPVFLKEHFYTVPNDSNHQLLKKY